MIHIDLPIIVEGKYDKIKLSSFIDATIITTDGFGIFKNKEKSALIKKLAEKKGIIVLTDSDSAGSIIRSYLKNIVGEDKIYNVFLPEIKGKEKRKNKPSSEGLLGVEGIDKQVIEEAFRRFLPDENRAETAAKGQEITKAFLMQNGLSGCTNSAILRNKLMNILKIPASVAPNTLVRVLNEITTKDEIINILREIDDDGGK